jgi:hypothetical protein
LLFTQRGDDEAVAKIELCQFDGRQYCHCPGSVRRVDRVPPSSAE